MNFEELDRNYIYNSHWNSANPLQKNNIHYENNSGLYDQWYISNPHYINMLTSKDGNYNIFKKYPYNKYGGHIQRLKLMEELNIKDKIKFYLYAGIDHVKCSQIFTPQYRNLLQYCID